MSDRQSEFGEFMGVDPWAEGTVPDRGTEEPVAAEESLEVVSDAPEVPDAIADVLARLRANPAKYCCPWCFARPSEFEAVHVVGQWSVGCTGCHARIPHGVKWYESGEKIALQ